MSLYYPGEERWHLIIVTTPFPKRKTVECRVKKIACRPSFLVDPKNPVESNIIIQTVRYGPDFRRVYIFSAVQ